MGKEQECARSLGISTLTNLFGAPATNDRCAGDQGKDAEEGNVFIACKEEEDNWWRNNGGFYHDRYCEDWDYLGWSDDESDLSDRDDTPLVITKSLQPLATEHNNKKPTTIAQLREAGMSKPGTWQQQHYRDIVHGFVTHLMGLVPLDGHLSSGGSHQGKKPIMPVDILPARQKTRTRLIVV